MDRSAMPASRKHVVEWFNAAVGLAVTESAIPAGSSAGPFTPPFSGTLSSIWWIPRVTSELRTTGNSDSIEYNGWMTIDESLSYEERSRRLDLFLSGQ